MKAFYTILLLIVSNVFMTFAWYGHLKLQEMKVISSWPLYAVILFSWGIALAGVFFPDSRQPHRIHRQWRPVLIDAAEGYSGGGDAYYLYDIYHGTVQRREFALESFCSICLLGAGCVFRLL